MFRELLGCVIKLINSYTNKGINKFDFFNFHIFKYMVTISIFYKNILIQQRSTKNNIQKIVYSLILVPWESGIGI